MRGTRGMSQVDNGSMKRTRRVGWDRSMDRTRDERGRFYLGRLVAQILIGHTRLYLYRGQLSQ